MFQTLEGKHITKQPKRKRKQYDSGTASCVLFHKCYCLPSNEIPGNDRRLDISSQKNNLKLPHVMVATLFRWPDLLDSWKLERLAGQCNYSTQITVENQNLLQKNPGAPCSNTNTNKMKEVGEYVWICCNPFHWSRVLPDPYPIQPHLLEGKLYYHRHI